MSSEAVSRGETYRILLKFILIGADRIAYQRHNIISSHMGGEHGGIDHYG